MKFSLEQYKLYWGIPLHDEFQSEFALLSSLRGSMKLKGNDCFLRAEKEQWNCLKDESLFKAMYKNDGVILMQQGIGKRHIC